MEAFLVELQSQMKLAVESVCHAKIDYLVMGISAETFWGGKDGAAEFVSFMSQLSGGLGITTGAAACGAVIDVYKAKKIGIITPVPTSGRSTGCGLLYADWM
jgi:maleate isomerase